ncbi:MAG: WD40 repeat domain-containing serine/threonine-protein kinase [Solirubrobacterales bacterium]
MADLDLCGRTLGEFGLRAKLGEGGSGVVYRAWQESLHREVVVKVLHPDKIAKGASAERFLREARLASKLDHPYAAHVYAFGVDENTGLWWIAMELVKGVTLTEWLKAHGPMPLERFAPFLECVAEVVHEAHTLGIIHRDLKPDNMMVIERGGRLFPKLLDFGIAKAEPKLFSDESETNLRTPGEGAVRTSTTENQNFELTRSGATMGSWPYTAPEQRGNAAGVDVAADIYSLGVVIFETLTGRGPFDAAHIDEYKRLHRYGDIPSVSTGTVPPSLRFGVAQDLDRVLMRALNKEPDARQATVLELASDLSAVLRASDREQLRSSAQQWEDRSRLPGLLWDDDVLAEVERVAEAAAEGELSELECSFVVASQQRARRRLWRRRALIALAPTVVVGVTVGGLLYHAVMQGRMAERVAIASHIELGNQALLHGESSEAVRHLEQAYQRGEHSSGVRFMFARALEPRMSELARFTSSSSSRMWSAVFAPDGKRVLTAGDTGARMWDAGSSQLLFMMAHGSDTVYGAVFSPDGSKIVTAGADGTVRIWSAETGAPIRELKWSGGKRWRYYAVAMSSRFVAAIDVRGKSVHVWEADTGQQITELDNDAPEMALLAFSADGAWIATSGRDEVRVFDTSSWRQVVAIAGPRVRSLAIDPTGPRLAVGTNDGVAAIWEIPSGVRVRGLRDAGASVDAIAFSRDGALVAAASRDGMEQVWNVSSGNLRTQFNSHRDRIYAVEFSSTGDLMLSAGADAAVVVSNVSTGLPVARLEGPKGLVITAHFDAESRRVVGASWDGTSRVWDAASPYRRWDSPQIGAECDTEGSLVPDQRFLAVSCRDHGTHVLDTARGELLAKLPAVTPTEGNDSSAFPAVSASGDRAAIARSNTVEIYALPSGQLLRTVTHSAAVSAVAFAAAGHDLVSGSIDGSLLITRDESDSIALPTSPAGIDAATILADGRVVVADASDRLRIIGADGKALLMDVAAPSRTRLLRPSPDGTRLITISTRGVQAPPVLWDLDQRRLVARLDGYVGRVGRVFTARFVADGGLEILTAGSDGTVRLWDAVTGRLRRSFRGDSHSLIDAALAPDASVIVAGGSDGVLRFWDAANGRLLWRLQAHRSFIVGVHYEGNELVTRGIAGDVARWALPQPDGVIDACQARTCTSGGTAEK